MSNIIEKEKDWHYIMLGILTIGMVWHHFEQPTMPVLNLLFQIDVAGIFFLAGSTYANKKHDCKDLKEIYLKNAKNYLLYYFIYSLVLLIAYSLLWALIDHNFSVERVVCAIIGIFYARSGVFYPYYDSANQIYPMQISNGGLWFVPVMIISEGLLWLYINVKETKREKGLDLLLVFLLIAVAAGMKGLRFLLPWSLDTVPYITLIMITGYEIAPLNIIHKGRIGKTTIIVSLLALAFYVFMVIADPGFNLSIREYGDFSFSMSFSLLCTLLGCIICCEISKVTARIITKPLLSWVGRNSYIIIGFHYFIIHQLQRVTGKTTSEMSPLATVLLLLGTIVTLGLISVLLRRIKDCILIRKK